MLPLSLKVWGKIVLFQLKWVAAGIIFLVGVSSVWWPLKQRVRSSIIDVPMAEALAAGVFLGAGLLHMLGDAAADFVRLGHNYPWAFMICGVTFLALLWLEHLGREFYEHEGAHSSAFAILAVLLLSIHALLAGIALGLANELAIFLCMGLAILAHKWVAGFSLSMQVSRSELSMQLTVISLLIFSVMTPAGILFGEGIAALSTNHADLWQPIFNAFAAGTFLYLGTLHGLSRAVMVSKCCDLRNYSFVVVGFVIMALVAIWS